jgi:flagellin
MPNLSKQDVGVAGAFITIDAKESTGGTALDVNTTGQEGGEVSISLPTLSANALDVSRISIMPPTLYDDFDNVVGQDSSNQYAVQDSLGRVQYASDSVSQVLAKLGAQSVALQEETDDGSTAVVNLSASQSAIRDANIAAASTSLAKDEVLTRFTQSVIAQSERFSSKLVLELFR